LLHECDEFWRPLAEAQISVRESAARRKTEVEAREAAKGKRKGEKKVKKKMRMETQREKQQQKRETN
jgi:hypothetical protein